MGNLTFDDVRIAREKRLKIFNEDNGYNATAFGYVDRGLFKESGVIYFDSSEKILIIENLPLYSYEENKELTIKELVKMDFDKINNVFFTEKFDTEESTYTKIDSKKSPSLGKAVVGGTLFGAAGAIIGGTSGKTRSISRSTTTVDNYCYRLSIDFTYGEKKYRIDFVKKKTYVPKEDALYNFVDEYEIISGMFQYIIEYNENREIAGKNLKKKGKKLYCKQCGIEVFDGDVYCRKCGIRL